MLAAELNTYSSCGVTAALKDCQTLSAEVVRLTEDSARLDWMDRSAFTLYRGLDPETGGIYDHAVAVAEGRGPSRRGEVHERIRTAIDAARKESR
jgi:hypothetical protein